MPTRNGVLTDHQAAIVEQLVGSGRYQNASEVLRDGLRLIELCDAEDAARLEGAPRSAGLTSRTYHRASCPSRAPDARQRV